MFRICIRNTVFVMAPLALACAFLGLRSEIGIHAAEAQPTSPKTQAADRPEDRAAIRSALESFAKALNSRDAKALAAHWTADGELTTTAGQTVKGRDALENAFKTILARPPEVKAEIRPESLRFLSGDSAVVEGAVTLRKGSADPTSRFRYKDFLVREQGKWLVAHSSELPGDNVSIADLAWMIGDWKSTTGQGAEIRTTYSWAPNKKFIHATFSIKEKSISLSGFQVIGIDPANGSLHTWTFEADGGIGEADWNPDGDHWVLDAAGTLPDGSTLTETNILRRVNDNTFTWQSVDRMLDDSELDDLAPVKVTRVKPAK